MPTHSSPTVNARTVKLVSGVENREMMPLPPNHGGKPSELKRYSFTPSLKMVRIPYRHL